MGLIYLDAHKYESYEKELDEIAQKMGFSQYKVLLSCYDLDIKTKFVKNAMFTNACWETNDLQRENFELRKEINRLRVYLE